MGTSRAVGFSGSTTTQTWSTTILSGRDQAHASRGRAGDRRWPFLTDALARRWQCLAPLPEMMMALRPSPRFLAVEGRPTRARRDQDRAGIYGTGTKSVRA